MNYLIYSSQKFYEEISIIVCILDSVRLNNFPKIVKLVKGRARTQSQVYVITLPTFSYLPPPCLTHFYVFPLWLTPYFLSVIQEMPISFRKNLK